MEEKERGGWREEGQEGCRRRVMWIVGEWRWKGGRGGVKVWDRGGGG